MNWNQPLRRYVRTFESATLIVAFGFAIPVRATLVADGVMLRTPGYSAAATMLPVHTSGEFTPVSVPPNNLGSFDIAINAGGGLSGNGPALAAFNRAATKWESYIADSITVTINADMAALGPGILGSASSVFLQSSYTTIRDQLVVDASNEADDAIVGSMPTSAQFNATLPTGFSLNGNMQATKANLKAMGFTGLDAAHGATDATITFGTGITFDYDNSDGVAPGATDFEGVAAHEIGHALGFVSFVDQIDATLPSTSANVQPTPLDLFRFRDGSANDPSTAAEFMTFSRNLIPSPDSDKAHVFDQVISEWAATEVKMSMGRFNGDGRQASHWKDLLSLGIMDPTAAEGELLVLGLNDLRAMDLIGYEISAVPELPAMWALPLAGALALGGHWFAAAIRVARSKTTFARPVVQ